MRRHNSAPGQLKLFEPLRPLVTVGPALAKRFAQTRELCAETLQPSCECTETTLQSKANVLLLLSEKHPLPCFAVARALLDIGVVRSAYDFSYGTEDNSLMMVIDRERGSKNFLEEALQYAAQGRGTDAQAIEQASELLRILSMEVTDNLTCAEKAVEIHVDTKAVMPERIKVCWWKMRRAYACFLECVEWQLASALPIVHMIANSDVPPASWQEAATKWRRQYVRIPAPSH